MIPLFRNLGLHTLRSNLTVIPQDPTLTGENTSPLSQNNTDSNGSGEHGPKCDSPPPQ